MTRALARRPDTRNRAHVAPFAVYRQVAAEQGQATPEAIARTVHLPLAEVKRILRAKGWPNSRPALPGDPEALDFAS